MEGSRSSVRSRRVRTRCVAEIAAQVRGKSSGAEAEWRYWQVLNLRDGKAIRIAWFKDQGEAMEAAGMPSRSRRPG